MLGARWTRVLGAESLVGCGCWAQSRSLGPMPLARVVGVFVAQSPAEERGLGLFVPVQEPRAVLICIARPWDARLA